MIKYILDGIDCNPKNKEEIEYVFDFTDRQIRELEISADSLTFVKEDYDRIKDYIALNGYFVGMPLDIQYSNGSTVKYLLDFSADNFIERDRSCTVPVIRFKGVDSFFNNIDGMSFGILSRRPERRSHRQGR